MSWTTQPYTVPLRLPYRWAKGVQQERLGLWVGCDDAKEGIWGWGEVAPPPHEGVSGEDLAFHANTVIDHFEGADTIEDAMERLDTPPRIRCGILGAWLDGEARAEGISLAELLRQRYGIRRKPATSVPVNALIGTVSPDFAAQLAAEAVAAGFKTLKIKCDGDRKATLVRARAVREAAPDAAIRLDANESWEPEWALTHIKELKPLDIAYIEQPLRAGRFDDLVRLTKKSPIPIALDESARGWAVIDRFIQAGTQPILILKPQRLGGADRLLTMAQRAHDAGLQCVVTNSLETGIGRAHALHLAALLPKPIPDCGLATEGFFAHDVPGAPRTIKAKQAVQGPGIGCSPEA